MSHVKVYIPCILFVTVSWISFIIDPKVRIIASMHLIHLKRDIHQVVPGRMSLLVILFLVIINTFNAAK